MKVVATTKLEVKLLFFVTIALSLFSSLREAFKCSVGLVSPPYRFVGFLEFGFFYDSDIKLSCLRRAKLNLCICYV